MKRLLLFTVLLFSSLTLHAQQKHLRLESYAQSNPNQMMSVAVTNSQKNSDFLAKSDIQIKYKTKNWLFIQANAAWLVEQKQKGNLEGVYYEFTNPTPLADSAVVRHKVNLVHQGTGLDTSYTGRDVIIGVVDQGLDFNHPDFKLSNGKTRVLRYWDHTINTGTLAQPYNYGTVWNKTQIDNSQCTSLETGTAHGTTVTGMATGNARANSQNKGVAPEADIIVVETDFNLPNWTLTIADACDYIFKVADSLGKPAVVNLSLGAYLGSHDGTDPAAEYIDSLLTAKDGRIVVCAAGNSGANGKYHVRGNVTADTSFVWSVNNPNNTLMGTNKILFDLWSDTSQATYNFAFAADLPAPFYGFRGRSSFHLINENITPSAIYDTIFNSNHQRIACIETYREIVGSNFHANIIFTTIDSLDYLFRFETFGNGQYDLWGGSWMKLSDFVYQIPSVQSFPFLMHYNMPDTLQTIVSSWNCSDKVISVANIRNRSGHYDKNGNWYSPTPTIPVASLEPTSSKGPTRNGLIKPDVAASGGISLGSGPMWFLSNPANNSSIDQGGYHVRNGGTSMASPVVAGIAALYLQKCSHATFQDFRDDLLNTANSSPYTGITPNNGYGYGIANAHETILQRHRPVTVSGSTGICPGSTASLSMTTSIQPTSILWSNGATSTSIVTPTPGAYRAVVTDSKGCKSRSNTVNLASYANPFVDAGSNMIICPGTQVTLTANGNAVNYAWSGGVVNGVPFYPVSGKYYVQGTNLAGCSSRDSLFIDFFNVQTVDYTETVTSISQGSSAFNVAPGIPSGGTYSGDGVIGTSFHPGLAGVGTHAIVYSVADLNGCLATDTSYITVYTQAGLDELQQLALVYPNPTQNQLNIYNPGWNEAKITDETGRVLSSFKMKDQSVIDVTKWSTGIYYLELTNEQQIKQSIKIIKSE